MTTRHATHLLRIIIDNSSGPKKDSYLELYRLITEGKFYEESSKKLLRKLNFRAPFIENISFLLSIQDEDSLHSLKLYRSKHGTVSLIDTSRIGKKSIAHQKTPHCKQRSSED
jgi:hypothetical protein